MKQYFTKQGMQYATKNNLQRRIADQVRGFDRKLVTDPAELHRQLAEIVNQANRQFPKCTPCEVETDNVVRLSDNADRYVYIRPASNYNDTAFVSFTLYLVREGDGQ